MIHLNGIATNLGIETCKSLALFHALTGSDSTSAFKFKGKRSCWKVITSADMSSTRREFSKIIDAPFELSQSLNTVVEKCVCLLYKGGDADGVDLLRMDMFSHKTRDVERIPPTSDALHQHLKRSVYQASVWASANISVTSFPATHDFGWREDSGRFIPEWMTLPEAKDVFNMDVKCSCRRPCVRCKCKKKKEKKS